MGNQSQHAPGEGFAGVYLRLGGHARFWGWGAPPAGGAQRPQAGRPEPQHASSTGEVPSAGRDAGRPAARFVCDRHFIGLVVR